MTKVTYTPESGMPETMTNLGYFFEAGKGTEISDEKTVEKLRGHPHFDVAGKSDPTKRDDLEKAAKNAGVDVDRRWSDETLAEKIEVARQDQNSDAKE